MPLIEDNELRDLFRAESEEHLQTLNEGILRLESAADDAATMDEVFRAAHSLKGAARMLGVSEVEQLAHQLEDRLGQLRRGGPALSADEFDRLYRGIDVLKLLVQEALTGNPSGVDVETALAELTGEAEGEGGPVQQPAPRPSPAAAPEPPPPPPPEPRTTPDEAMPAEEVEPVQFIDDPELRDLFRAESEEHLQTLDEGLLRLETTPDDEATVAEVFRAAHSLKGAARMLGAGTIEALAHGLEDRLGLAKREPGALTPDDFDRLYGGLDVLKQMVREAVTGEASGLDAAQAVIALEGEAVHDADVVDEGAVPRESETTVEPPREEPVSEQPPPAEAESAAEVEVVIVEDSELRDLFREESEAQLRVLDEQLLQLEEAPNDLAAVEEAARAANNLKGSAKMLSIGTVELLARRFEKRLIEVKQGSAGLNPESIDGLFQVLVALRQFVGEALGGPPAALPFEAVMGQLEGTSVAPAPAPSPPPPSPPEETSSEQPPRPDPPARRDPDQPVPEDKAALAAAPPPPAGAGREQARYRVDTIRVDPQRLDALMVQSGELAVTKLRVAHRLADIEALAELVEDWQRDMNARRFAPGRSERPGQAQRSEAHLDRDQARLDSLVQALGQLERESKEDSARLDLIANGLEEGIRSVRMLPLSTIFNLFPRTVRDLARQQSKEVQLVIEGGDTTADKLIIEDLKDPMMHMIRNAIDHGIEPPEDRERTGKPREATLRLRASQTATNILIEVSDDGRGLDVDKIRATALKRGLASEPELLALSDQQVYSLITRSGFSTADMVTDVSGRGVGMDVVHANVEQLKGSLFIDSEPGHGTTFQVRLPLTLATTQVLILSVEGRVYALPVESVETTVLVDQSEVFSLESRDTFTFNDDEPVSITKLTDLLELPPGPGHEAEAARRSPTGKPQPCVVLSIAGERLGLLVDELRDEQEVVLKPHSRILRRVRNVAGSTILETGQVCIVLNPHDLMRSVRRPSGARVQRALADADTRPRSVLLAEDSLTTRVQMTRILQGAGYEVMSVTDGQEAFDALRGQAFDALVSDVQMPNMSGLELTERVRQEESCQDLPVILVTSLASEEDRKRGAEAGADAYITKPAFDQTAFLETLRRLL